MDYGSKVKLGTNPLIATDDVSKPIIDFEKGKKVILRGVNFEFNKAILMLDSEFILEEAYKAQIASSDIQLEVLRRGAFTQLTNYREKKMKRTPFYFVITILLLLIGCSEEPPSIRTQNQFTEKPTFSLRQ